MTPAITIILLAAVSALLVLWWAWLGDRADFRLRETWEERRSRERAEQLEENRRRTTFGRREANDLWRGR